MKNVLIIGAGGFGREIYNFAKSCTGYNREWAIKGFLDDEAETLDRFNNYPPIIGPAAAYEPENNDIFVCAAGSVEPKKKYTDIILKKGGTFLTLIHPSATVYQNTVLGNGCLILQNCFISCDITIGDFVTIQPFCTLGHDVKVGNYCHLNTYAFLGGRAEIEDSVTIHTGGKILPSKKVGRKSIVGAGSVVVKNVPADTTVFGNPAVKL